MRSSKFYLITALLVLSMFSAGKTIAETLPAQEEASGKAIVLAKINVQDAIIVSQEGNTLELSFSINNREGAQSGVKYGVRLVEKLRNGQKAIDEFVYPEVLSVPTNASIHKTIKYTAPATTEGTYYVYVSARNYSGLPLGSIEVGKATFTKQLGTVEILAESCSTEIVRAGSVIENNVSQNTVSKEDKIILSCYIKNNLGDEVLASPIFETRYRTLYGDEVPQLGGDISPVLLRPLEEKLVNLTLPKIVIPQSYITKVYFKTNGVNSNYITMAYTVSGLSATIQNVSLDKNSYKANEEAKIAFFWTSSATKREELTSISLTADIVNSNKRSCIDNPLNTQLAGVGFIEIPVTINKSCDDPEVTIALLDATGKVLDQKALVFEANEKTNLFQGKTGIIAIIILALLVIAGIIIYVKKLKKDDKPKDDNNNTPKSGHIEGAMLAIFFILSMFLIPGGEVKADTIYLDYYVGFPGYPDELTVLEINVNKSIYQPEENITFNAAIVEKVDGVWGRNVTSIDLSASTNERTIDVLKGASDVGSTGVVYFTAPENGGSYSVNYSGVARGQGGSSGTSSFSGSIPYVVPGPTGPNGELRVTVYAKNTSDNKESSDILNIYEGTEVEIRWIVENGRTNTVCSCTYGSKSCGSSAPGVFDHKAGIYMAKESVVFKVECKPN
jgi:hypothetical protein